MNKDAARGCAALCWECRHECMVTLYKHCLELGGKHMEAGHVRLMTDCIDICQLTADFLVRESRMPYDVCDACAEICDACAKSCERLGGAEMLHCAELCRRCADACRAMRDMKRAA